MCLRRFLSEAVVSCVSMAIVLLILPSFASAQNKLALSPDGKFAAYTRQNGLWIVPTAAGAKPRKIADVRSSGEATLTAVPRWSPSSERLAYYSHQSGSVQLWMYEPATERNKQISFVDGGVRPAFALLISGWITDPLRYSWSPDGSKIVFTTQVDTNEVASSDIAGANARFPSPERLEAGEPIVLTNNTPREWTLHGVVSYSDDRIDPYGKASLYTPPVTLRQTTTQLFVLDVESGKHSQLTHDTAGYFTPDWSPDGKQIAYMSSEGQPMLRGSVFETNIFTLDLATSKKTKITQGRMQKITPRWSPDGKWISYHGKDISTGFIRKDGERYVVRSDGGTAGNPRNLTASIDRETPGDAVWSPDGSEILTWYIDGIWAPLVSIDAVTGEASAISPPKSSVASRGVASSRSGVIWAQLADPNGAETLWFRGTQEKPRMLLEIEPAPDLRSRRRWEVVQWVNHREEVLEGMLLYPLQYDAKKRYPIVVDPYGSVRLERARYEEVNYEKASSKYFVFRPNHRAPHMYVSARKSATYDAAAVGPTGMAVMADDILSGVDKLIERGLVDSTRMCVAGFSNGALEGAQLLTQTNRFKCAMLQSGNYDWIASTTFSADPSDSILFTYRVGPWEDPSIHVALSPVLQAAKITTPILLAVGDREGLVIQAVELYTVLRYLNKEVTLLRYPNEGHGLTGAAQQDSTRRIESFFSKYLDGEQQEISGAGQAERAHRNGAQLGQAD